MRRLLSGFTVPQTLHVPLTKSRWTEEDAQRGGKKLRTLAAWQLLHCKLERLLRQSTGRLGMLTTEWLRETQSTE